MERCKLTRSMEPASTLSRAPTSFLGPSSCCGSRVSSSETSGRPFLAQMHEHHVYRQPVQPGGKRRLAAEGRNLAIELQERFLCEVFRLGGVARHAQTERIHTALVKTVQGLETLGIALLGAIDRFLFRNAAR